MPKTPELAFTKVVETWPAAKKLVEETVPVAKILLNGAAKEPSEKELPAVGENEPVPRRTDWPAE